MPKCKICGARIEDGVAVCPSCGAKVASSSAVPATGTNADVAAGTVRPRVSSTTQVIKTTCPACGAEVVGEHRFCPQCGVNLKEAAEEKKAASQPKVRRCPSCGSVIAQNARFCPDCGVTLASVTGTARDAQKPSPSAGSTPKKSASTSTASSASSSSATVTHASPVNTRNLRVSLIPESLSETTAYFDTVQDACTSSVMSDKGGLWTLAVEGDLTEDELDTIVDLAARTGIVKCLDLSSCANAQNLKTGSFFSEDVFGRCKGLESVKLSDGNTRTKGGTWKPSRERTWKPSAQARQNGTALGKKKRWKGILVAVACIAAPPIISIISENLSRHSYSPASSSMSGTSSSTSSSKSVLKSSDFVLVEGDASISSFYMCQHEVTQEEYQTIMGKNPSHFKGDKRPVEQVSFYDAVEYCNKRSRAEGLTPYYDRHYGNDSCNSEANGYRLPTASEWEFAAREGKYHSSYTYSGSDNIASVAWYVNNSEKTTHDVMTKISNNLGLYDMSGNVWEWCCSSYYVGHVSSGERICGGSFSSNADDCAVSSSIYYTPNIKFHRGLGFRVVRSAK